MTFKNVFNKFLTLVSRGNTNTEKDDKIIAGEIGTLPEDLRAIFQESRVNLKDIECPPEFSSKDNFHILLADDNQGAVALLEIDLEIMFGKMRVGKFPANLQETLTDLDKYLGDYDVPLEVQTIIGDYTPYSIYKKFKRHHNYRIDFAIIDIIYGSIVYEDDKPLRIDGIDVAKIIMDNNPKAEVILFTGSELHESGHEYKKIKEYFGKSFFETNVVLKNPDFESRLYKFADRLKVAFSNFIQNKENDYA